MLATGTAAEVTPREQDRCAFGGRLIQFKVGIVRSVVIKSPIKK